MMNSKHIPAGFQRVRHDRLLLEETGDAYQNQAKPAEPAICPQCNVVFHHGRWCWDEAPQQAHRTLCPACRRTNEHYPAGYVTLEGPFFMAHRDEILRLIHNLEQHEKQEHPLQRIMSLEKQDDGMLLTTTDVHLARGIGEAVHKAYQGDLEFHYNRDDHRLRVHWVH